MDLETALAVTHEIPRKVAESGTGERVKTWSGSGLGLGPGLGSGLAATGAHPAAALVCSSHETGVQRCAHFLTLHDTAQRAPHVRRVATWFGLKGSR